MLLRPCKALSFADYLISYFLLSFLEVKTHFQHHCLICALYTFAAGNGGLYGDSCAYSGYLNSIYTIAIAGVNHDGSLPTYAEECPGIMATAYSWDSYKNKHFRDSDKHIIVSGVKQNYR